MTREIRPAESLRRRAETCEVAYRVAVWNAARDAGYDIHLLALDEVRAAASCTLDGPAFNGAYGLDRSPGRLDAVLEHYRGRQLVGWLQMAQPPWSGAIADFELSVLMANTDDVTRVAPPPGVSVTVLGAPEVEERVEALTFGLAGATDRVWVDMAGALARDRRLQVAVATVGSRPVARASLYLCGSVAALAAGWVRPDYRGRGIHRTLIAARAAAARDAGAVALIGGAARGSTSERNQLRLGFRLVAARCGYRVDPH